MFRFLSGFLGVDAKEPVNIPVKYVANGDGTYSQQVSVSAAKPTPVDKSGTIAAGGTAQVAIAANADRNGFIIQNVSTENLWFTTSGTAVQDQPSFKLEPGIAYQDDPRIMGTGAVSIIGATTGQAFAAREW